MSLIAKVEDAFVAVVKKLEGFPATVRVFKGSDEGNLITPCVVCHCKGGPEEPVATNSGNRMMSVSIQVISQAKPNRKGDGSDFEPRVTLAALSDLVFGGLKTDDLGARLTGEVENFYAYDPVIDNGFDPDFASISYVEAMTFTLLCAGADLG